MNDYSEPPRNKICGETSREPKQKHAQDERTGGWKELGDTGHTSRGAVQGAGEGRGGEGRRGGFVQDPGGQINRQNPNPNPHPRW